MTDPTDPTNPIDPSDPGDPVVDRLRDALRARADSVEPTGDAFSGAEAAAAASARSRLVRNRALFGAAAAAAIVAGVLVASALTSGSAGHQRLTTAAGEQTSTSAPDSTTAPPATTIMTGPTDTTGPQTPTTSNPGTVTSTQVINPPVTTIPPTTVPTTTVPSLPGGSTDPKSGAGNGGTAPAGQAVLTNVRTSGHAGFDRVVIEFAGDTLPGWSVGYAQPPFTLDASGAPVAVAGQAFLHLRLDPATEIDPATGHPSYTGGSRVPGSGTADVIECVNNGDFEGVVSWVIGLHQQAPFTVHVLSSPARIVIDIAA